jgi:hypothetical protein
MSWSCGAGITMAWLRQMPRSGHREVERGRRAMRFLRGLEGSGTMVICRVNAAKAKCCTANRGKHNLEAIAEKIKFSL